MYYAVNFAAHNWYLMDALDIPIYRQTLIIGPSGAGKSSLTDAFQTVISGNNRNVMDLNASAGKARDRRVLTYMQGCVTDIDDGAPRRESCETTLAITFRDDKTGHYVTIGLMMTISKGQPNEETKRFICKGYDFRISDFVERDDDGGEYMVSHDIMASRLRQKLGKNFVVHTTSSRFVDDYLTTMRPGAAPTAANFLRAFGNTMQNREFQDSTHFVRSFVLTPMPIDINRIQESISRWRGMEDETIRLTSVLAAIAPVKARYAACFRREIEQATNKFLVEHLARLSKELEHENAVAGQDETAKKREQIERNLHAKRSEDSWLRSEKTTYQAALKETDAGGRFGGLEAQVEAQVTLRTAFLKTLQDKGDALARLSAAREVVKFLPTSLAGAINAATALKGKLTAGQAQDWVRHSDEIAELVGDALQLLRGVPALTAQRENFSREIAALDAELSSIEEQLRSVERTGNNLSPGVQQFQKHLHDRGIESQVLATLVDVGNPDWAYALEVAMGSAVEAVLVPDDNIDEAQNLLRLHRREVGHQDIIDTKYLARKGRQARSGSIAEVAVTQNPSIRAFLDDRWGYLMMAETQADFGRIDNAILKDGKRGGSNTRTVGFKDRSKMILGKAAQVKSVDTLRQELQQKTEARSVKRSSHSLVAEMIKRLDALDGLTAAAFMGGIDDILSAESTIASLRRQQETLKSDDHAEIEVKIDDVNQQIKECAEAIAKLEQDLLNVRTLIHTQDNEINRLQRVIDHHQKNEAKLQTEQAGTRAQNIIDLLDLRASSIETAILRVQNVGATKLEHRLDRKKYLDEEINAAARSALALEGVIKFPTGQMFDFIYSLGEQNPFSGDTDEIAHFRWLTKREDTINNHELLPHKAELAEARAHMERALKEDLCTKLGENFEEMDRQIKALNKHLGRYTFVGQQYQFGKSVDLALKPLYDLVKAVMDNPHHDLFALGAASNDAAITEGMAEVERIISGTTDTSKLGDYRNYFKYEMTFSSPGSSVPGEAASPAARKAQSFTNIVGTLSGGQRQAPFYVAIAASMVKSYFPSSRRTDDAPQGMGVVLFDEAFEKLDIPNTSKLMKLFGGLGLQVIVAAPEEKRASLGQCVDSIINVNRLDKSEDVSFTTVAIGPAAKAAMEAENPVYKGIDAFRTPVAVGA